MPNPRRLSLGEALITTTLLSIYLGSRCTALAIGAAQTTASRQLRRPRTDRRPTNAE